MLAEKKTNTNIGIGAGLLLQFVGSAMDTVGVLLILAGAAVFIWGCINYAQGKGHSGWLGLLGLLSLLGLIILVILPDQHKSTGKRKKGSRR